MAPPVLFVVKSFCPDTNPKDYGPDIMKNYLLPYDDFFIFYRKGMQIPLI